MDSEILVRLARRHALTDGFNMPALLRDMARCEGHIAAVLAWADHPETVIFIRRDKPLFLAWHASRKLLAYASERGILATVTAGEPGWHIEGVSQNTALVLNANHLPHSSPYDFE